MQTPMPTEAEMMERVHRENASLRAAAGTQQQRNIVSLPPLATPANFASAFPQLPGSSMPIRLNHALPNHVSTGLQGGVSSLPSYPSQPSTSLPGNPSTSNPLANGHQAPQSSLATASLPQNLKGPTGFMLNHGSAGYPFGFPGHLLNGVTIRPPGSAAPSMVMSPAMHQAMLQMGAAAGVPSSQAHMFSGALPIQPLASNGSTTTDQKPNPQQLLQQHQHQQQQPQQQQQQQQPQSRPQVQGYSQAPQQHAQPHMQSQPHIQQQQQQQQQAAQQHRQPSPMPSFSQPLPQMSHPMSHALLQQQQAHMLQSRGSFPGLAGMSHPMSHAMTQHHHQQQQQQRPAQHATSISHAAASQAKPYNVQQGVTPRTSIDLTGAQGAPHIAVSSVRPSYPAAQAPAHTPVGPAAAVASAAAGNAAAQAAALPGSAAALHAQQAPGFDGKVVGVAPTPLGGRTFVSAQSSLPVPPPGMKLLSSKAVARLADGHEVEQKVLEPAVVQLAEAFVEAACSFGCSMARRRKGRRLEALDMADYLERNWQVRVPGFLAKEVRPLKRLRNTGHQQRQEAVQQLQATATASQQPAVPTTAAAPALPAPAEAPAE